MTLLDNPPADAPTALSQCDKYEVGRRIRAARHALGWSLQRAVDEAAKLGYQWGAVSLGLHERAERGVKVTRLHEIAVVFRTTTEELMVGPRDPFLSIPGPTVPLLAPDGDG